MPDVPLLAFGILALLSLGAIFLLIFDLHTSWELRIRTLAYSPQSNIQPNTKDAFGVVQRCPHRRHPMLLLTRRTHRPLGRRERAT